MASQWFIRRGREVWGPLSDAEVRECVEEGSIKRSDMMRRNGTVHWVRADKLKGLFPPDDPFVYAAKRFCGAIAAKVRAATDSLRARSERKREERQRLLAEEEARRQERRRQLDLEYERMKANRQAIQHDPQAPVTCPRCGSTQISADKKGFSVGKAGLGCFLLGPVGLAGGMIGSSKVQITCLKCGNVFAPGGVP